MPDPTHIANWQRLDARLTSSGQPTEDDLRDLARLGVRHVINLALHSHEKALADEAASVAAAGMRYTHIPVPFDAPTDAHWQAFCTAMAQSIDTPTHVHCIVNYRVSAFLYRWHRDIAGMDEPAARALMERQWAPDKIDRPQTRPWADFIARRS